MSMNWDELEAGFLSALEQNPLNAEQVLEILNQAVEEPGGLEKALLWAVLAQDACAKAENTDGGIQVLKWRVEHVPADRMTSHEWLKAADVLAGSHPDLLVLIQEAGFGGRLAPRECVRRLRLLYSLQPGVLCLHRTWGFGIVRKADSLYKKIDIDFKNRPNHSLAMDVAATTLDVLDDDHILTLMHRTPEKMEEWITHEPATVVKLFLDSFGPTPVQQMQQRLAQLDIVSSTEWKKFWDAARKALKADPLVDIPAKRTEPLRLLHAAAGHDADWFDRLSAERDLKTILDMAGELINTPASMEALTPPNQRVLSNRLAFVLLGATAKEPSIKIYGAMLAKKAGLAEADCAWAAAAAEFLADGSRLVSLLHDLPARDIPTVLEFLLAQDKDVCLAVLLEQLSNLYFTALQPVLDVLLKNDREEAVRTQFAEGCGQHTIRVEFLLWLLKNQSKIASWDLPPPSILAPLIIRELEEDYMGERLKAKKQLREKFESSSWLKETFGGLTPGQRKDLFRKINTSPAWPGLERQTLQAKILKLYPELQVVLTGEERTAPSVSSGPVTSQRSYRERQAQLEKLINIDIPANSKEIAIARSYGDLRENFEYKAAKDMQALLLARRGELELMLGRVRPTDFADAQTAVAGVGTTVLLQYADGREEQYTILGEWDQDTERNVISSATRLAKALTGKKPGDAVEVPTEEGAMTSGILKSVTGLSNDIREWIR